MDIDDIAMEAGSSLGTSFTILHEHLEMRKLTARLMPRYLDADQMAALAASCLKYGFAASI